MAPPPPPRRPPALLDELVEEILLRLPPDDPAPLVRAGLVCKPWRRLVSDPGFRRRFRRFHRTPPMLGFLYMQGGTTCFEPTSSFCLPHAHCPTRWYAADVRHGRILFSDVTLTPPGKEFIVLNPMTGDAQRLPMPQFEYDDFWAAAFLCATLGCDHLDCPNGGPFTVVFLVTGEEFVSAWIYSSEAATWSETTSVKLEDPEEFVLSGPITLCRSALYFACYDNTEVVEYSLGSRELSFIRLPPGCNASCGVLMIGEEGGLELAMVHEFNLCIWLREDGPDGFAGWARRRVIELVSLLPACALSVPTFVIAGADGIGVIFVSRGNVLFTVDLKSLQVRKVLEGTQIYGIVPYMSFYTPALSAALQVRNQEGVPQMLNKYKIKKLLMKYGVRRLSAAAQ
ncbi:hypothetical protein ACP70R_014626 [Stipagrostis hirtigluma subsp. patula]